MNILVTGGAGFIGSHICEALTTQAHRVSVLDNLSSGKKENLSGFNNKIEFIEADIRDTGAVATALVGIDVVFHEAAIASVPASIKDPAATHAINATGMLNVLEASRKAGVKKFMYASSAAVYGDNPKLPKEESMEVNTISFYAAHKHINEIYATLYSKYYGLQTVGLRYFNVFGPRQDPSSPYSGVISLFMDCYKNNRNPLVYGNGLQTRDFIYVKDVVQANLLAMSGEYSGAEIFNVGTGRQISLNDLLSELKIISGKLLPKNYESQREGDIQNSCSSIEHIKAKTGFSPQFTFEEGLREFYNYD